MSLASFPPTISLSGSAFPPAGPGGNVPRARWYYALLRIPIVLPAALRFLRLAVPRSRFDFDTCAMKRGCTCLRLVSRYPLPAIVRGDGQGLPGC